MRLADLLDEYAARKLLGPKTRKLHRVGIGLFSRLLIRPAEVADFTDANLARYAAARLEKNKAASSIAGEQSKLLALWRFAAQQGYIAKWPTVRCVRVPDRVPVAWTRDELKRLFESTQYALPVAGFNGQAWWTALFLTLYDTGERIEAALSIEWSGVDLVGRTIMIPAEVRKGKTSDRLYKIAADTAAALELLPRDKRRMFWWPYCHETLYNRLKVMMLKGGLPADRKSKFHRMRKTTASHFEALGGNATEFLGHTSRKVTRAYLDPRITKPEQAVDRLFRPGA
jgi:integrase